MSVCSCHTYFHKSFIWKNAYLIQILDRIKYKYKTISAFSFRLSTYMSFFYFISDSEWTEIDMKDIENKN